MEEFRFPPRPLSNHNKTKRRARRIYTPHSARFAARLRLGGYAPVSTHRPETVVSQSHTDFSPAERVDRVESVALLDDKRPYSTLMFSRKERKGRKRKNWLIVAMG